MVEFLKMLKTTSKLSDEEASKVAAAKIHESLPKSRMFHKIGASRNMGGGKKVNPESQMNDKLKVILPTIIYNNCNLILRVRGDDCAFTFFRQHHDKRSDLVSVGKIRPLP